MRYKTRNKPLVLAIYSRWECALSALSPRPNLPEHPFCTHRSTRNEMHTKDFKVLCERFAIAYNPLHNSRKDGLLSQEKFKEICKSIAQQVAPAMLLGAQHLP